MDDGCNTQPGRTPSVTLTFDIGILSVTMVVDVMVMVMTLSLGYPTWILVTYLLTVMVVVAVSWLLGITRTHDVEQAAVRVS